MFYGPVKTQYFSTKNAEVEVEIVPCHAVCERLSTTPSCGERSISDIKMLEGSFPVMLTKDSPVPPGRLILCLVLPTDK